MGISIITTRLTNYMEQSLSREADSYSADQEISSFYRTWRFITELPRAFN